MCHFTLTFRRSQRTAVSSVANNGPSVGDLVNRDTAKREIYIGTAGPVFRGTQFADATSFRANASASSF